jgi:hypothetical protein
MDGRRNSRLDYESARRLGFGLHLGQSLGVFCHTPLCLSQKIVCVPDRASDTFRQLYCRCFLCAEQKYLMRIQKRYAKDSIKLRMVPTIADVSKLSIKPVRIALNTSKLGAIGLIAWTTRWRFPLASQIWPVLLELTETLQSRSFPALWKNFQPPKLSTTALYYILKTGRRSMLAV